MHRALSAAPRRALATLATIALGIAASPAYAGQPACESNPTAKITPEAQTVAEGTWVGNVRTPTRVDLNWSSAKGDFFTLTQTAGPTVDLLDAEGKADRKYFLTPDVPAGGATLEFTLTVTGCSGKSATARAVVNVTNVTTNRAPVAVASASPATVAEGQRFTLDGSGSTDADGDALTYSWDQYVDGSWLPVSTAATVQLTAAPITNVNGVTLTFRLTVSDGSLAGVATQLVNVTWQNDPPVAVAECTSPVDEGQDVLLDATRSTDDDGDGIASYLWEQLEGGPTMALGQIGAAQQEAFHSVPKLVYGKSDTMRFSVTVTDNGGLSTAAECPVKINDKTPPELAISGNSAEATSASGAAVSFTVTATDGFDGDEPASFVECTQAPGSTFPLGNTPISCTGHDKAGNPATATFTISVTDMTPPEVNVPADITAEATGPGGAKVTFEASATDIVDGAVAVACSPVSGTTFALGTTTVKCTATDAHSNEGTSSFKVTVQDTTPPELTVPTSATAEATGANGAAVIFSASATDLVDGSVNPVCTPASGSTFALGATTVTCTAADAHGNAAQAQSFTVTVQDTTPPALTLPANMTVEATGPAGAAVTFSATANDLVDGEVAPGCTPASSSTFALGTTTVTCIATDSRGNAKTDRFAVTVVDTTGPAVTPPADVTMGPTNAAGANVPFGAATAIDLVDGNVTASCAPASNTQFGFGTTIVTCTAKDARGNPGTATFRVTVTGFTFSRFFQPVDNLPAVNTVKNGSTVPVKWRLAGDKGLAITDTAAVDLGTTRAVQVACGTEALESAIEVTTTGGTSLRYDTSGAQFILNWQTPKQPGTCWSLEVAFKDGSKGTASFKLK